MARGRCAGCGHEDASARQTAKHVNSCPAYLELYRTDPARALSPEAEAERWARFRETDEHAMAKHEARERFLVDVKAKNDRRIDAQQERWASRSFRNLNATSTPVPTPEGGVLATPPDDPAGRVAARQARILGL